MEFNPHLIFLHQRPLFSVIEPYWISSVYTIIFLLPLSNKGILYVSSSSCRKTLLKLPPQQGAGGKQVAFTSNSEWEHCWLGAKSVATVPNRL